MKTLSFFGRKVRYRRGGIHDGEWRSRHVIVWEWSKDELYYCDFEYGKLPIYRTEGRTPQEAVNAMERLLMRDFQQLANVLGYEVEA